jgi:hypothetical protein
MRWIDELSSKSGPGRFPYRQNEYEREEKWQLSAERVPGALSTPAADPRPSTKVKITSGKPAPKNNWIWTQKLKQQHGSGVGSLVHTAESRQGTNTDSLCTHEKKFARRKQATNPVKLTAHTNSRNRKMKSRKHGNRSWTKSGRSNPRRLERRKKNQAAKKK